MRYPSASAKILIGDIVFLGESMRERRRGVNPATVAPFAGRSVLQTAHEPSSKPNRENDRYLNYQA